MILPAQIKHDCELNYFVRLSLPDCPSRSKV